MTTIDTFLLARIEEDERRLDAPDFTEADSVRGPGRGDRGDCPICGAYAAEGTESVTEEAWYQHAEWVHQRARVLAECEAKRDVVENAARYLNESDQSETLAAYTLNALAVVYVNHPDYDPAWRL